MSSWAQAIRLCPEDTISLWSSLTSDSTNFLSPLLHGPWTLRMECDIDRCLTCGWALHWHFDQLWVSALTIIECTRKLQMKSDLTLALAYRQRDMSLENGLIRCLFSKRLIVGSPLGPVTTPLWVLSQIYSTKLAFPSVVWSLNPIRNCWLLYNINASIIPMGISYQEGHYLQVPEFPGSTAR